MRRISGLLFVFLVLFSLGACKDSDPVSIVSIDIDETSIEAFYHMDEFDLSKIEIILDHEDGSSTRVPLDESMLTGEDLALLETTGTHTITVYHASHETVITIVILETGATEQTILFETGEGSQVDPLIAYSGTSIDAPTDPQREGHTFLGWFTDESFETPYVFDVMPEEDLSLYAKWEINTYQVTFYDSDGVTVLGTSMVDYGGSAVAPEDPTKEEDEEFIYVFNGWDKDFTDVREDMDVFATYVTPTVSYTVNFWNYDGTLLKEEIVFHGFDATAPEVPAKPDTPQFTYVFDAWDQDFTHVQEDLDVFALFTSIIRTYTVTFLDDDGTLLKEEHVKYAQQATAPDDPFKEHHTFTGWDETFDRIVFDLTVTARYTTNTYTVTFKDHDETVLKTESVLYDTAATPPEDPFRNGYTFIGWDKPTDTITGDLIVHALYEIATYQLTFEDHDGTILHMESFEYGSSLYEVVIPQEPERALSHLRRLADASRNDASLQPHLHGDLYQHYPDITMVQVGRTVT